MKRWHGFAAVAALVWMSPVLRADAILTYRGADGIDDPSTTIVEMAIGEETMVTVGVQDTSANGIGGGGLGLINFAGLADSAAPEVTLSDWYWFLDCPFGWGNCTPLPDPQAASFGPIIAVQTGGHLDLAQLNILLEPSVTAGETFEMSFGTVDGALSDGHLLGIPLDDNSNIMTILAVPEPSSLLLLIAAALGRGRPSLPRRDKPQLQRSN